MRPIDKPEDQDDRADDFDPRAYTAVELEKIEAALRLMAEGRTAKDAAPRRGGGCSRQSHPAR